MLSPLLFNIVLDALVRQLGKKNELTPKEEITLRDAMIFYIEKLK